MKLAHTFAALAASLLVFTATCAVRAADEAPKTGATGEQAEKGDKLVPLNKQGTVLVDSVGKRILLKSKVVLREGQLELLCCLKQTKEHEAILSVDTKAYVVHAGLLAIGAVPGKPVEFVPEYKAPTGQKIDIFLNWTDDKGKPHRVPAQNWVRNAIHRFYVEKLERFPPEIKLPEDSTLRWAAKDKEVLWFGPMTAKQRDELLGWSKDKAYQKAIESFYKQSQPKQMEATFVFAGSGFFEDEQTKQKIYRAEDGDLLCVANFASATIDVAVKSTSGNEDLMFEAYTDRIPPRDTEVTIELIPVFEKKSEAKPKAE